VKKKLVTLACCMLIALTTSAGFAAGLAAGFSELHKPVRFLPPVEREHVYQAIKKGETELKDLEAELGPDAVELVTRLNELGELYIKQLSYPEAEALFFRALTLARKAGKQQHLLQVACRINAARILVLRHKHKQALPMLKKALKLQEKQLGNEHHDLAVILTMLAELEACLESFDAAAGYYERVVVLKKKHLGPRHLEVSRFLGALARINISSCNFTAGEEQLKEALHLQEQLLHRDHPDLCENLVSLAIIYETRKDYEQAEALHRRNLAIIEQARGDSHLEVSSALTSLGLTCQKQGKYREAAVLYERAILLRKAVLSPDHSDIQVSLGNLAAADKLHGTSSTGEKALFDQVVEETDSNTGSGQIRDPSYPDSADRLAVWGQTALLQKLYGRAESRLTRAMKLFNQTGEAHRKNIADVANSLGVLYLEMDRLEEAETLFNQALEASKGAFGYLHCFTATVLGNLADVFRGTGRHAEASALRTQAGLIRQTLRDQKNE